MSLKKFLLTIRRQSLHHDEQFSCDGNQEQVEETAKNLGRTAFSTDTDPITAFDRIEAKGKNKAIKFKCYRNKDFTSNTVHSGEILVEPVDEIPNVNNLKNHPQWVKFAK